MKNLEITEEEEDVVDFSGFIEQPVRSSRWAVVLRVREVALQSHGVLFCYASGVWTCAKEVKFVPLDDYTFTTEFKCFGEWNTAMHGGPWLFRNQAVVVEEYDGLTNVESMALDSIRVWTRIMGLPDLLHNKRVAEVIASKM